jgi:hypothetical protein
MAGLTEHMSSKA